jgi:hypothetical protein
MTTLPPVAATAQVQTTHLDDGGPAQAGHALGTGSPAPADAHGADALARFTASHEMHPLVQQQQAYVKTGGAQVGATAKVAPKPVPDAATRTYDVATTSKADIEALKNSPDKQQQRLGHTLENLQNSYRDLLDAKQVSIKVTMNPANGKEPVATIASTALDPNKTVRVHTHYHGDNATIGDPVGSKAGLASRIREIIARDPQTVFVLPECQSATPTADGPKHNNGYRADWGNVKSQVETTEGALRAAGINPWKVGQETVSFHSRGGEVIEKLMKDDKTGASLRADRLELLDCLYGSPDDVAAWGRTDNGKKVGRVIYVQGTNVESGFGNDSEIRKTFKGSTYIRIDISHKDAARHADVKDHDVRKYHPDPHYQTTGRYLGVWPLPLANG